MGEELRDQQEHAERNGGVSAQQRRRNRAKSEAYDTDVQYATDEDADRILNKVQRLEPGRWTLYDDNGEEVPLGDLNLAIKFGVKSGRDANKAGYDSFYEGVMYPSENDVEVVGSKDMRQGKLDRLSAKYGKEYMSGYESARNEYLESDRYLNGRLRNAGSDEERLQALTDIMHTKGNRDAVRIGVACLGSAAFAALLGSAAPAVVDSLVPALENVAPEVLRTLKGVGTKVVDAVTRGASTVNEYISPLTRSNMWNGVKMFNKLNMVKNLAGSAITGDMDKIRNSIGSYTLNTAIGNLGPVGALYSTVRTGYKGVKNANALIGDTVDLVTSAAGRIGDLYSDLTGAGRKEEEAGEEAGRKWGKAPITEAYTPSRRPGGSLWRAWRGRH